eukprot:GFUD01005772.1.p1 GENE.GFUD01005772.1~~GFUD01005772.1.p1  ORF type:complete len:523 (-),score=157.17 GFUD01005772.1:376-1893(-)
MNDTELNINLKALKKVDPYIISIEAHSSQVALYKFHPGKGDWEKTEVEGTLFVYQREAEPQYGFTIMNRLNMDNLVEPVTKELDFQLQTPFLLYRNHAGDIYGIWFYEQVECERVGKRIELLVKGVEKKAATKKKSVAKSGDLSQLFKAAEGRDKSAEKLETASDVSGKNLLRLLSQNDQPGVIEVGVVGGPQGGKPPPQQSEKTTASVKDFFAMASSNEIQSTSPQMGSTGPSAFTSVPLMSAPPHLPPTTMMSQGHPPVPITALPISQGLAMGAVPVAGYHIFQTPQHIMPPTTMPPANVLPPNGSMAHHPAPTSTMNPMVQRLMSNPGIHSVESIEAEIRRSTSPNNGTSTSPPDQSMTPNTKKLNDLESQLKQKLQIGSSSNMFAPVKGQPKLHQAEPIAVKSHLALVRQSSNLMTGSNNQPTLLSPQVFSSGRPTESPSPNRINGHNGIATSPPHAPVTPLTQPQMVEAMTFLLENDPDFVQQLHQAYVMSINRKFQIIK